MANPFPAHFESTCDSCGESMYEGNKVYAVDGQFYCEDCADANGNVCDCGAFKKEGYAECFACHELEEEEINDEAI